MSIGAAWLILIVLLLRLLLKQAPKWVNCVLWGFVGLRLVCPFVPESRFSLMPEVFRMQKRYGAAPDLTFAQTTVGAGNLTQNVTDGFYVTSGHSIEVYSVDTASGKLGLVRSNTEVYDENGNAAYYRLDDQGQNAESTEEEYQE